MAKQASKSSPPAPLGPLSLEEKCLGEKHGDVNGMAVERDFGKTGCPSKGKKIT